MAAKRYSNSVFDYVSQIGDAIGNILGGNKLVSPIPDDTKVTQNPDGSTTYKFDKTPIGQNLPNTPNVSPAAIAPVSKPWQPSDGYELENRPEPIAPTGDVMGASTTPESTPQPRYTKKWQNLMEKAYNIAQEYGIHPSVLIGQMALESGRGASQRANEQNNFFGYDVPSDNSAGATFKSPEESIRAYAELISKAPRYKKAMANADNPFKMAEEIKKAGYAADPQYVEKLTSTPEFIQFLGRR